MILDELHGLAEISASAVTGLASLIDHLAPPPLSSLPRSHTVFPSTDVPSIDRGVESLVREIDPCRRADSGTVVSPGMVRPLRTRVYHVLSSNVTACGADRLTPDVVGLPVH